MDGILYHGHYNLERGSTIVVVESKTLVYFHKCFSGFVRVAVSEFVSFFSGLPFIVLLIKGALGRF